MAGGKQKPWHFESRFVITPETVETVRSQCSPSSRYTWVCSHERLQVHTLRGVPGKLCDILLPQSPLSLDPHDGGPILVCEIGLKTGSFDGAKRWRLTFREWPRQWDGLSAHPPSPIWPGKGTIVIEEEPRYLVVLARWYNGGLWAQSFPQLDYRVEPGSAVGCVLWHWKGWYSFLPEDDVRQAAEMFDLLPAVKQCRDIVVLNRLASSLLYDLARQLGWRKLTLREKGKYGIASDSPQWQRIDGLTLRLAKVGENSPTGCGQYTIDAANGRAIRTSHGLIDTET